MKRSSRFRMLLKIEKAKEREEARKFAERRQALHEKKAKLAELEGYVAEYRERFSAMTRSGSLAGQIRSSYEFINRLTDAVSQQQQAVSDSEQSVEEYRQLWLQAKRRMDILQKTVDKLAHEELVKDGKREQVVADELARRKYQRS